MTTAPESATAAALPARQSVGVAFPAAGRRALAAIAGGGLTALAFLPESAVAAPLALVGPALCYRLWERDRAFAAFLHGWLFSVVLLSLGGYWLYLTPKELAHIDSPLAESLTAVFIAVMGLYMGVAGALYTRLRRHVPGAMRALVLLPAVWVAAEWARGWVMTGFPWFSLGYAALDTPLAGWAPLLGSYGVSAAVAATAGAAALLARLGRPAVGPAALLLAGVWGGGMLLGNMTWTQPTGAPLRVALAQPYQSLKGVDNLDRWQRLLPFAADLARDNDIILWPESTEHFFMVDIDRESDTAFFAADDELPKGRWKARTLLFDGEPHRLAMAGHEEELFLEPLERLARETGTAIVIGASTSDPRHDKRHNSLLALGGARMAVYDKRHLVPFGETIPLRSELAFFWDWLQMRDSPFDPSRTASNLLPIGSHYAGVSVCYESAFGREIAEALPRAAFLIMASNDRIFEGTTEPYQHQQVARMRALEAGRWVARVNLVGITAVIAPDGRVIDALEPYREGVLQSRIVPMRGSTPYVMWNDWAVLLLLGVSVALGAKRRRYGD